MSEVLELDLLNPASFANGPPHDYFDYLRRVTPVIGQDNPVYPGKVWSLTRFKDMRAVGNDTQTFTNHSGTIFPFIGPNFLFTPGVLLATDPPEHTRLRNLLGRAFSPRIVAQFDGWIREICVRIVDRAFAAGRFDAVPLIASELPAQVIASILGVPEENRQFIINETPFLFGQLDPEIGPDRALVAKQAIIDFGVELAGRKRIEPGTDMVSELVTGIDDGNISAEEFKGLFLSLYTAGYETTHTLIAHALWMIASDPEIAAQVRGASSAGMRPQVEELVRLICPINYWGRIATKDAEVAGQPVAKGDYLMMWFTAANRDPDFFEDPHSYRPSRKGGRQHAAFGGGGPHLCIGAHLAKLELEILLDEMNRRGLRLELDGEPTRNVSNHVNGVRSLPMRVAS